MNSPLNTSEEWDYLTVADYAKRFGMSENTVRTRINRGKLRTARRELDGRETICIAVKKDAIPVVDHSELVETIQQTVQNNPPNNSERSNEQQAGQNELLSFMRDTMQTVQGYTSQLVELSRENERYKVITDSSSRSVMVLEREIEELKAAIFERDARIKELEQKLANPKEDSKPSWQFWKQ